MSFGSGGFGSFGQQNQTSGFGGFGSTNNTTTTGFGSNTNTFGSNTGTGTGLFGNSGGSGFGSTTGGFGSGTSGAFGAKPAFGATTSAGGGLFGSTTATAGPSGFGSGGGFGSTNTGTSTFGGGNSLFGSKPAFGGATTGGGLFGSTNTTSTGFGGTSGGFGATTNPGIGTNVGDPPGTATVPFQPFIEKEANSTQQNSFQNILFLEPYRKWSAEELRLADYNQGRRYGNTTGAGAFGTGSNFGGFGSSNTTTTNTGGGLFGSSNTNTFGTQNTSTTGGFGSTGTTGGGLFGAKPATTGGLFGSSTNQTTQTGGLFSGTGGGFGTGATSGFGTTNNTTNTGSLFGNTANKPATGFGFGTNNQTTGAFGSTGTTSAFGTNNATTGGGLFGNTNTNTTTTGGGLFGSGGTNTNAFGSTTTGAQAGQTGGLFGAKPATGGLFGTATNTANSGTTGGGLFGNTTTSTPFGGAAATPQTGGLFQTKPATATGTGGGLFGGGGLGQTGTATTGGLFGNLGQNTQNQQQPQQTSLFGSTLNQNQQKPSLFGSTAPAASGSLFGNSQTAQPAGGGLFGQPAQAQQQQNVLQGGSLFGNSLSGSTTGTPQGLTTSITDAGAYGAPSLFQNLAASEVHNPGPLATPLSGNKTKTSRRSSILPLYKMNPGSASKFTTPQKRGYGFSYSAFGTPTSVSSTASTPAASMSQSLLAGSIGRGLGKSISSSNLRRTYNAEDSILLPGAFSASSGPRYYGSTGGSKKLIINRDMRADLFSTPSKVKDTGLTDTSSDSLGLGSTRKLTKRVSFDTTIPKDSTPESGRSTNGNAATETDLGYLRPSSSRSTNGSSGVPSTNSLNNGSAKATPPAPAEPEMEQVTGKELAIVHEEEASPVTARCIPENYRINNKELGEYWMSPSKDEIERMNRVQRQQVSNFTVGRTNVGQVRFRVPVDLTKINLDSIMGGIVTLIIRSATVYPDVHTKPPVGQGLNVPAEIMLLHTCPRSGPDVSATKMKHHIQRLKGVPDTTFISYEDKTAAWTFAVEHFTTYGLDDDDDETDNDMTGVSTAMSDTDDAAAAVAAVSRTSGPDDDTFDFRRRKRVSVPGAFDSAVDMLDDDDEDDTLHQSFLSNRSAEMSSLDVVPTHVTEHDQDMELAQDDLLENEAEAPYSLQQHPAAEPGNNSLEDSPPFPDLAPMVQETPGGVMRARIRAIKESNTPLHVQVADGDNWMDMLQKTVSPQKRDRAALKAINELDAADQDAFAQSTAIFAKSTTAASRGRKTLDNRGFATSIDLMNSLFEKSKAPPAPAPAAITTTKGFVKWPYKRQGKPVDNEMTAAERAYHNTVKPAWSADGACILGGQDNVSEPALKRVRVFDAIDSTIADDPLDGFVEHRDAVDIEVVNGVPSVSTRRVPHMKSFAAFSEQANRRRAVDANTLTVQLGSYEQSVWELASVLFDPIDGQSDPTEVARIRKENLGKFWAQLVQDASTKSLEQTQSLEEKAVVYLSGRRVPEACRALVDGKNFKAATLVSLIGTSDAFRKDMREQNDDWYQGDVLAEFSVPIRAIYSMLAGNVAVCEGKKGGGIENRMNSVVLSDYFGLDWKQAFGLRLWYGVATGEGVETAVAMYLEDLEQGRVPFPHPWYVNQRDMPATVASPQREDLLFGLLKVAAGLANVEDVLVPESSQPSPFRYRLCWQLNQALAAAASVPSTAKLPTEKADTLTSAYAAEVMYHTNPDTEGNAWVHDIWVLLHLSDPTSRIQAIQDVLARHTGLLFGDGSSRSATEASLYECLVEDLKIPAAWVWQAAALYWRNQRSQPALEAECLLRASAYADAHRIFVKELAPKAIVERNYGEIAEILSKLQSHRHQISEWSLGGEVYSRFLDLLTLQRGGTIRSSSGSTASSAPRTRGQQQQQARAGLEQAAAQLANAVESLVSSLPAMYDNASDAGPTEVAAITEMADVVARETMALANKGRMDLTKISRLPLTEDRRVRYSTDLAFAYYREVMSAR